MSVFGYAGPGGTASGDKWTQRSSWSAGRAGLDMCSTGKGFYRWTVTREKGTYHQIGIALSDYSGSGTSQSGSQYRFAFLYSHSSGWNRHRGAATPVGTPSASSWWSGVWDRGSKGSKFQVTLDCAAHQFEVRTENQYLGTMAYPKSWGTVFAAAGGQSNDNTWRISPAFSGATKNCLSQAQLEPSKWTSVGDTKQILTVADGTTCTTHQKDPFWGGDCRKLMNGNAGWTGALGLHIRQVSTVHDHGICI